MPKEPIIHEIVVKVEKSEMACRIGEAAFGVTRPEGESAIEALEMLTEKARNGLFAAAEAAMQYFYECNKAALGDGVMLKPVSVPTPPPGKVH